MTKVRSVYERLGTVAIQEVIKAAPAGEYDPRAKLDRVIILGESVGIDSLRMKTFIYKGTVCSCCNLEATHFAVERHVKRADPDGRYHLNLWGVKNGHEVLFTHDHTIARSNGGADNFSNTTTMCTNCNNRKGIAETAHQKKISK